MSHAAEGLLQSYMDGEVTGSVAAELDAHLSGCAECEAELQRLRAASALLGRSLQMIDEPLDAEAVQQAYWRASSRRRRQYRVGMAALARAAGLLLLVSGGVMAVIPGSPLRRAAEELLQGEEEAVPAPAPVERAPVPAPPPVERAEAPGVMLVPSEGRVQVRVWSISPGAELRVNLVDGVRVSVQAGGDASDVRFRSGTGRIEVMNLGTADVSVQIPRSLPFASVEVDGRQWLFKDGDQLRLNGPVVQQSGDVVIFRAN